MIPTQAAIAHEMQEYGLEPMQAIRRIQQRETILENNGGRLPYMCGGCGSRFANKSQKRQHKLTCADALPDNVNDGAELRVDPAGLFGRPHLTPEIVARARAEWDAMDWRGRLPKDWVNPRLFDAGEVS
jgi:hypothetical protein